MVAMALSYRDPLYSQLARTAETKFGLPTGILDAIRTHGERSNANQVSPAGARTVYQFIPSTREAFIRKKGIDPWSSPEAATNAAAIHVLEDFKRTGSWDEAIARYHGGQRPGPRSRRYAQAVGSFDVDTSKPYYTGANEMPINPYMGMGEWNPLAPEPIKDTAPIPGDPGPSAPAPAAAPAVARKRGGLLGALESIFMPDPESRWAGALRDGLTNAKESQHNYIASEQDQQLKYEMANAKLHQMLKNGEFQVVGNNVFHTKPDGSYEMIAPPQNPSEHERLIQMWQRTPDNDPAKSLIERLLLGGNSDEAFTNKERVASTRAGATTQAARIRANTPRAGSTMPPLPPGFTVVK